MDLSWDVVDALLPDDCTAEQIEAFLRRPEVDRLARGAATHAHNRYRSMTPWTLDETVQEARMVMWELLRDPAARASARRFRKGLVPAVVMRTTAVVKDAVDHSVAGATTTQVRRWRGLATKRAQMVAELHREPGDEELVAAYNADRLALSADPARSGMLATTADLATAHHVPLHDLLHEPMVVDDDVVVFSTEARALVDELVVAAAAASDTLGRVARAWTRQGTEPPDDFATVDELSAELGMSQRQVREHLARLRLLARDVLAERFGITVD